MSRQFTGEAPYDPNFYDLLAKAEDRHFWFVSRRRIVSALLKKVVRDLPAGSRVLEIGCGTGYMTRMLQEVCPSATVLGMDLFHAGLLHAAQRTSARLLVGDIRQPPFARKFQLVALFDVLEHIADDAQALRHIYDLLLPGGRLVLTVPAHPELWSYFDVASRHQRRYALENLNDKLTSAGFQVLYSTEFLKPLYFLLRLKRRLLASPPDNNTDFARAHRQAVNEFRIVPVLNGILSRWLSAEAASVSRLRPLSRGSSILALAFKP